MSCFADMGRVERNGILFVHGPTIKEARAGVILALSAYADILGTTGACVTPRFSKDRLLMQAMDTLDAFLEEETLIDLGL